MRRLFVLYGVALTAAVLLALLVPLGLLARTLAEDRAMTAARQEAQALTVLAATSGGTHLREVVQSFNHGDRRITVFLPGGAVIGAPAARTRSVDLAFRGEAFTATTGRGQEVLLPVAGRSGVAVVRAFVPESLLRKGVPAAWATLALVGVFLLGAAATVGTVLARRLAGSVTGLAEVADRVGAGELDAKADPAGPPEVVSVARVLNTLGARVEEMLAQERELSADLSHRLRTPVTALRLDVDSLSDPTDRRRMSAHVDALTGAVDAAVAAARSPRGPARPVRCDADRVLGDRARFWSVLAEETGRSFTVSTPGVPAPVDVSADQLGAALDALMDNVFSHTPAGTPFALSVAITADGGVEVVVADAGPGVDAVELTRRGHSGAGSTGLGLDVANRTAAQAGGRVTVADGEAGGARVVMSFPPAALSNLNRVMVRR